jgi:hypothetical protein
MAEKGAAQSKEASASCDHRLSGHSGMTRPLLAQSGHLDAVDQCPLLGVKRTCLFALHMSAIDPKRTSLLLKNRRSVVCHFSLVAWSQSARL